MAYAALSTIQTIAAGQVFTAATLQQINDNGEFLIDPPACSIKETTAQAVTSGATGEALTSDEENYDNDSMHSTASNTTRITIQTAGRYNLIARVGFDTNATGARSIFVKVNGTTSYVLMQIGAPTTGGLILTGVINLVLSASDYVECWASQTSGGDLNVTLYEFAALFITR